MCECVEGHFFVGLKWSLTLVFKYFVALTVEYLWMLTTFYNIMYTTYSFNLHTTLKYSVNVPDKQSALSCIINLTASPPKLDHVLLGQCIHVIFAIGKFVPSHKVHPLTFKGWRKHPRKINRLNWSRLLHNRVWWYYYIFDMYSRKLVDFVYSEIDHAE